MGDRGDDQGGQGKVHELAGGWITERAGRPVPVFLKLAYAGFSLFGLGYMVLYWSGETGHASRGRLVAEANKVMEVPAGAFLGFLLVLLAAFAGGLLWYALRPVQPEE